jgi:hypothetical protein
MTGRILAAACLVLVVAVATGCGASPRSEVRRTMSAQETVDVDTVATTRHCDGLSPAKQKRQRRRLEHDLTLLRTAAATVKGYTQNGNARLNSALDRFQLDVAKEALPVFQRSTFINRAAAIVSPRCYLCFQALEANRPVAAGAKLACG